MYSRLHLSYFDSEQFYIVRTIMTHTYMYVNVILKPKIIAVRITMERLIICT